VRLVLLGGCTVVALAIAIAQTVGATATAPSLTLSPDSNLHNGQSVSLSVGPNGFFTPHSHVNILECADPGGKAANLPKDDSTCDGNTIQGMTVLVAADGSFSASGYTVYSLPSVTLGEQSNDQPVCNATNPCVLFVGQDQNNFTSPKVFSAPFTINPATVTTTTAPTGTSSPGSTSTSSPGSTSTSSPGTSATSTPATTGSTTSATTPSTGSGVDPAASLSTAGAGAPTSLATTGPPAELAWVVGLGSGLVLIGSLGRRRVSRARA
jgi:hypothetical protein